MVNGEKEGKKRGAASLGEAGPPAPALCVPMHIAGIIDFKAGMSTGKVIKP
jgi:hypothetical protein